MSALKQKIIRDQVSLNKQDGGAYSMVLCKSAEHKKSEIKPKAHFEIPAQDPIIKALHSAPAAS